MSLRQTEDCSLIAIRKLWDLTQWMLGSSDDAACQANPLLPAGRGAVDTQGCLWSVIFFVQWATQKKVHFIYLDTLLILCFMHVLIYIYICIFQDFSVSYASKNALFNSSMSEVCLIKSKIFLVTQPNIRQSIHFPNLSCWHRLEIGDFASHKLTKAGLKAIATGAELEFSPALRLVWCRFQVCRRGQAEKGRWHLDRYQPPHHGIFFDDPAVAHVTGASCQTLRQSQTVVARARIECQVSQSDWW